MNTTKLTGNREEGYYHVKYFSGEWGIAYYRHPDKLYKYGSFIVCGDECALPEENFEEIDPTPIVRKEK